MYDNNITHLDIKPENYLIKNNNYTLIDFHVSKYHHNKYYYLSECETVGTRSYLSPEVKKGYYSKASDIYSLGCMLYCIYTRSNPSKIDKKIIDKKCDIELKNLILAMTEYNSYYRPTIYEIHDYLT